MFTRVLEFNVKPDMMEKFHHIVSHDILPILRHYPEFVDLVTMRPQMHTDPFMVISFWRTKEMAEEYHKKDFPKIMDMIRPFIVDMPKIMHYHVEFSTFHQVAVAA